MKPGSKIVDLGSTPGSWCQYAVSRVTGVGRVVGVDLLPMQDIERVQFIQGDFTEPATHLRIAECFEDSGIDLVLSDMAPNITGIRITDQANAERLQYAVLAFCLRALNQGGNVLTKLFEGESVNALRKAYSQYFDHIQMIKPDASRSESREIYLLARKFNRMEPIHSVSGPDNQELF
jgi:23S rRNA (uridine2552-2'-O)-methyltransferase